jgi:hypothetical protein
MAAALVLNVALNAALIPAWGAVGSACAAVGKPARRFAQETLTWSSAPQRIENVCRGLV